MKANYCLMLVYSKGKTWRQSCLHIDNCPTLRIGLIECLVELPDGRGAIIGKFSNWLVVVDE